MDEFVTFNTALALISSNKESSANEKAIELIDLYLNGDIDLYIELSGKGGKRSFPYCLLPHVFKQLDDFFSRSEKVKGNTLPEFNEKVFVSCDGALEKQLKQKYISESYISNFSYFVEDEMYELEGIFKVPLDESDYFFESYRKVLFYGESSEELSKRGVDLAAGGLSVVASLDGQIWSLYAKERVCGVKNAREYPDMIFPDINAFLLRRDQISDINKTSCNIVKRPNAAKRNQDIRNQIIEAALYELANNYTQCLKNGVVRASRVVDALILNHKAHWPDGCGMDKEAGGVKSVPLSVEKMERLVRDAIRKKN